MWVLCLCVGVLCLCIVSVCVGIWAMCLAYCICSQDLYNVCCVHVGARVCIVTVKHKMEANQ